MSRQNPSSTEGKPQSGFRPYPMEGFQIQPPSNYWQGNNFMMPGINPGGPTMTSDLAERFPGLAQMLKAASPPPLAGGPFVGGAMTSPLSSMLSQGSGMPGRDLYRDLRDERQQALLARKG